MEIGEMVNVYEAALDEDEYCKGEAYQPKGWQSRIKEWGSDTNVTAKDLYKNMKDHETYKYLQDPKPFVAKSGTPGYPWDLNFCNPERFPIQAHHLIPKSFLPKHRVCTFLAKKYTKGDYKLIEDSYYDTDHANNGYCMPYATPLQQWTAEKTKHKNPKNLKTAFDLMDKTNRQLHQGSHKYDPYKDPLEAEEEDENKNDEIHKKENLGYQEQIDKLLHIIHDCASSHVEGCPICRPHQKAKSKRHRKEIYPVASVVKHMNQVSGLIKLFLDRERIFTSKLAYYWGKNIWCEMEKPDWLNLKNLKR